MQLSLVVQALPRLACGLALLLGVSACNNGNAAGEGKDAPVVGGGSRSYVLVTEIRPEALDKYFAHERTFYKACVSAAQGMGIAVKPFPDLPKDFVAERHTYASDGKRVAHRDIAYYLDARGLTPKAGCELRLASQWSASVAGDGQERVADQDEDGNVNVSENELPPVEAVRTSLLASRTVSRKVNGVPLKCDEQDNCIVDPGVALVAEGPRPVLAAYRNDDVKTHGTALIARPLSLVVGKPVDPRLFSLEEQK